jgi:hypothetical protein
MKKIILAAIAGAALNTALLAGDFDLSSLGVSDLKPEGSQEAIQAVPVSGQRAALAGMTKSPNMPAPALDMTIKLPFRDINKRIASISDDMKVIDPARPVISRQGDHLLFTNVTVVYKGIECEPTIQLKPVFEGSNRLGIRFLNVVVDIAFGPNKGFGGMDQLNKDDVMAFLTQTLTGSMMGSMDEAFRGNKVALRAKDIVSFTYDKSAWNLRAFITPGFVAPLLPGLISNVSLSAFSFDDSGFALSVKSGSASAIAQLPGYNLALSDGLLDNFIAQFTKGTDFESHPKGHEGGLKFRADGRLELAGKIYARDVTLKPNVYFKATILPVLTGPNTIKITVERVDVDKAFGIGIPGFINNWIQGKVVRSVVETLMANQDLAKVMTPRKLDDKTVELKHKNSAFLPSFAAGAVIKNMKIGNGLMYLGFQL